MGSIQNNECALHKKAKASTILDAIAKRRADAGKLVAGVAAASSSDMFKGLVCFLQLYKKEAAC